MGDILQAMKERFSTRGYTDEKLTDEELNTLIHAGLQAPTATNRQEIHITVVKGDNPILKEIEEEMLKGTGRTLPQSFYYGAPVLMLLSGEKAFGWSAVDAGIAVENIALAAEALGLGNLIIGCIKKAMNGERQAEFASRLGIPEGYQFEIAIAVGHKATSKVPHEYSIEKNVNFI
ncbi:MAG: nitroreductase family protein [Christensenellaceae bacterium]|nr:nitroreductase family protein [Christensenellaceae bacterium]